MALPSQVLNIPAGVPIDEASRPELLQPGQANRSARNVRMAKRGGLTKRKGYASKALTRLDSAYSARSAGYRLFSHGQQTCIIDGTYLDTWASTDGNVTASRVPECGLSYRRLASPGHNASGSASSVADVIVVGTRLVVASLVSDVAWATIYDYATGQVLVQPDSLSTGEACVLGFLGDYAIALVADGAIVEMYYIDTDAAGLDIGWTFGGNVASDRTGGLSCTSVDDGVAFSYINNSAGVSQVTVKIVTPMGVSATQTINTASVTPDIVSVAGSSSHGTLWVTWNQTSTIKVLGLDPENITGSALATAATIMTLVTTAPSYVDIAAGSVAGKARVIAGGNTFSFRGVQTTAGAAATDGSQIDSTGASPIARPMNIGGRYYVLVGFGAQNLCILVDFTDGEYYVRPVANAFPSLASSRDTVRIVQAGTKWVTPINVVRSSEFETAYLLEFDFNDPRRWLPASHGGVTYLSGGLLTYFDGQRIIESGFLMSPGQVSGVAGAVGTPNGDYRAVATFEECDSAGNWTISGVSEPSDVVSVTTDQIEWSILPINVSLRPYLVSTGSDNRIRATFWRTLAGGEPPYYRLPESSTENDPSATSISFTDNVSDATLATQAKLYAPSLPGINGSAQDRRSPPGFSHIVSYNGMLVGATGEDVWYSGQDVSGEAAWWNPIFQVPVSGDGDITGLAAQDGTLFIFKRRSIFAVAGEPPSDNGAAGGLGVPRRLAVDVGCIDARSIVVTSFGIFFQSERGIELLNRGQSVDYIGEQLQTTLTTYPYVVAATLDPQDNVVIFELSSSSSLGSGSSVAAVFDLSLKGWISVDDRNTHAGSTGQRVTGGAMAWDGTAYRYSWLGADGRLRVEQDAYYDTGSGNVWVIPYWEPAYVKIGLVSEQRTYNAELLVERHSAAGLLIEQSYDYETYLSADDKEWTESATSGQRIFPWRPKPVGAALGFMASDSEPATFGTGQGFTFIGICVDIAAKRGATTGLRHLDPSLRR